MPNLLVLRHAKFRNTLGSERYKIKYLHEQVIIRFSRRYLAILRMLVRARDGKFDAGKSGIVILESGDSNGTSSCLPHTLATSTGSHLRKEKNKQKI